MYKGKLILFTAFYKYETISPYAESLHTTSMVLNKLGIDFEYWNSKDDFHIERSFNHALTKFALSDADDFINIDSDEAWEPASVVKILQHDKDIVTGVYRQKNEWGKFTGIPVKENGAYVGEMKDGKALLKADRVPAGFLRVRKTPLLAYMNKYPDKYFMYQDEKVYPFFWNEIEGNTFFGMDYAFSEKMKELGFELWIDPNLDIAHYGLKRYDGNYDEFLRGQKAINEVKERACQLESIKSLKNLSSD